MPSRLPDLLDDAVSRGLITSAQRTQLLALATADDPPRGLTGEFLAWTREVPRGLNAISIAYAIGALTVVFALVWFLADRWTILGPPGVLAVGCVYAVVFMAAALMFRREGFVTAQGLAMILSIVCVPLITWAALRTTGVWAELDLRCDVDVTDFWNCRGRVLILAATAFVTSLMAMRSLSFGPLMIPGAVSLTIVLAEVTLQVSRGSAGPSLPGWSFVIVASMLVCIAHEVDRRRGMADYGRWLHLAAALCAAIALGALFGMDETIRRYLLPTALAMMTMSLYLRRVVWLVIGLVALWASLLWMAREVFERTFAFPVLLGLAGIAVILVTVLVQRQYPRLAERVRSQQGVQPRVPGGAALLLLPAIVVVFLFPVVRREAQWDAQLRAAEARRQRIVARREAPPPRRRAAPADIPVLPLPDSTKRDSLDADSLGVAPPDSTARADSVQRDSLDVIEKLTPPALRITL